MLTTIQNDTITVSAETLGAELQSIRSAEGIDYLWNGDPSGWSGRASILFPFVGSLRNKRASCSAGEVSLPQHGFARRKEWTRVEAEKDAMAFCLTADEETRKGYPYDFAITVRYSLGDRSVTSAFTVENTGDKPMPYTIGGHPGFHVPLVKGENFEDYLVEFDQPETADCPQVELSTGLIIDTVRNRLLTEARSFRLNHLLFRGDALIFDQLKSHSVKLYSEKSGRGVKMDFTGMNYLGIWSSMHDSPLVCLEPWNGMGTLVTEDDVFEHKRGMRILEPGQRDEVAFTLSVF